MRRAVTTSRMFKSSTTAVTSVEIAPSSGLSRPVTSVYADETDTTSSRLNASARAVANPPDAGRHTGAKVGMLFCKGCLRNPPRALASVRKEWNRGWLNECMAILPVMLAWSCQSELCKVNR